MLAQRNAAAAGMGLVMCPTFLGADDSRLVGLHIDGLSVKRELWLSTHEDLRYVTRVKAVVDFIKSMVERDQDFLDGRPA